MHNLLHFTFPKYIYKTVIILLYIFNYYNLHIYEYFGNQIN